MTVRVIAGSVKGRRLTVPPGDTVRPTKDRVREAVFSALDARDALTGASVLDLFAGTGAMAIEALSRGAARAVLVERERHALDALTANVAATGFTDVARVERRDVHAMLTGPPPREAPFGLVCCDPPYDTTGERVTAVLAALLRPGWLASGAAIVVERPTGGAPEVPDGLEVVWERAFGDTLVLLLHA